MAAKIKKVTLRKMSAKDFSALLKKLGACAEARRWAKGKTLQKAWATCDNGNWMEWLLNLGFRTNITVNNWPTQDEVHPIDDKANDAYWAASSETDLKDQADMYRKYVLVK